MVWILQLNDMRSAHIETKRPVYKAETRQQLIEFMARETVEPYRDGQWGKSFRSGGPLEWFNPPFAHELERDLFELNPLDLIRKFTERLEEDIQSISGVPTV